MFDHDLPNVPFLLASFVHLVGLCVWLGGIVALGAIAAPVLFRTLPRTEAGALFGPMLRVFEKVSLVAMVLTVAGAVAKAILGGQNPNLWVLMRDVSLAGMVGLLLAANFAVHPAIRRLQAATPGIGALPESDPVRQRFQRMHKLSERMMSGQLLLGLVVLLFA
jgi:hypothetical protein